DEHAPVGMKIVQILANAQHAALAMHMTGEGALNRGVLQGGCEDFAGDITHVTELLFALRSHRAHAGDYMSSAGDPPAVTRARRPRLSSVRSSEHEIVDPFFNRGAHLFQAAFEEMISGLDAHQSFRIGDSADESFEFSWRAELIARSAHK